MVGPPDVVQPPVSRAARARDACLWHVSSVGGARRRGCAAGGVPECFNGLLALDLDLSVAAQRVVGDVEVVALADEEAERALAVARRLRRHGEPARQQLARGGQLVVLALGHGLVDQVAIDAELAQAPLDALPAPAVEIAPVLGEAAGERGVVDVAALQQRRHDLLDEARIDALLDEVLAHLRLRAVTVAEKAPGDVERLLPLEVVPGAHRGRSVAGGGSGAPRDHAGPPSTASARESKRARAPRRSGSAAESLGAEGG